MIRLKINEKSYDFPESFGEITMKQYCNAFYNLEDTNKDMSEEEIEIIAIRNEAKIISRLLGENDDFVLSLPIDVFNMIRNKCGFIYDIAGFMDSKIFYLNIDGRKYFMPEPNEMALRQFIDADMIMKEENKNQFIELLACLLLPLGKDGKYEYDGKYQDLIPKIENMKASDGLPFIYTFFKKKVLSRILSEDYLMAKEMANQHLQHIQNS